MPSFPSRRRLAQVALPTMLCAALIAGAARARSAGANDDAMPLTTAQTNVPGAITPGATTPAPEPPGAAAGDAGPHGAEMHGGWGMRGAEHREAWAAERQLRIASRLATMHVYLDITPQQEDAWHAFSQAVLAMVPEPQDMPDGMKDGQHPMGMFDGIDRMAKMMQRRADAAQAVDQAAQKLKASLTPAQVTKADAAWAALREHWEHAHWHHHDHDHDRDDH
jgi:hypothetical protein